MNEHFCSTTIGVFSHLTKKCPKPLITSRHAMKYLKTDLFYIYSPFIPPGASSPDFPTGINNSDFVGNYLPYRMYCIASSFVYFRRFRKSSENRLLDSLRLSVRPSAWNDSAPIGRIFMKFDV